MSDALSSRLEQLRRELDASFAAPPRIVTEREHDLLAIRAGGAPWALSLEEITHVQAATTITRAPSPVAALLGLASVRRTLLPVYHLGALLGGDAGTPRWLVVVAPAPVALAIDAIETYVRVPASALIAKPANDARVPSSIRIDEGLRPVLDVAALCEDIARVARAKHERSDE